MEQKDINEILKGYFEPLQPVEFGKILYTGCVIKEPELSSFSVQKAYMNSSFILETKNWEKITSR